MWTFAALVVVVLCLGAVAYFAGWERTKQFFKGSETIAWAWGQMFVGAFGATFVATDFTQLFANGWPTKEALAFFVVVFLQGLITKLLRERRDPNLGKDV